MGKEYYHVMSPGDNCLISGRCRSVSSDEHNDIRADKVPPSFISADSLKDSERQQYHKQALMARVTPGTPRTLSAASIDHEHL